MWEVATVGDTAIFSVVLFCVFPFVPFTESVVEVMDFAAGSGVVAATVKDVATEDGVSVLEEAVVVDGVVVAVEGEVVDFSVGRK